MQTPKRPQSLKLRQAARQPRGQDIGNLHIIDWHLAIAARFHNQPQFALPPIGRYLDGEEEQNGTYR
jgi:hypothetical protein